MSPENFYYWLKGFLEMSNTTTLSQEQVKIIKNHLNPNGAILRPLNNITIETLEELNKSIKEKSNLEIRWLGYPPIPYIASKGDSILIC